MKTICSREQTKFNDNSCISSGTSSLKLMLNAGKALLSAYDYEYKKTLIVCGGGNNGGDGLVLALLLKEKGEEVSVCLVKDNFTQDSLYFYKKCQQKGVNCFNYNGEDFSGYDILVDAVFGVGFSGEIREEMVEIIEKINSSNAYIISADIPSGLDCNNGKVSVCVKANLTVAINNLKLGYYLDSGKDYCGKILLAPIDIPILEKEAFLLEKNDFKEMLPPRQFNSHKGIFGYVAILGGSEKYSGAAKLANLALSALRVGAGVVKLAVPSEISGSVSPYLLESTLFPMPSENGLLKFEENALNQLIGGVKALGFGPGIDYSEENEKILDYLLKNYLGTLVIDADGINALSRLGVNALKTASCSVVLTPHIKEFSRLCGYTLEEIKQSPTYVAQKFAKEYGVTLLLKGTSTIVTNGEVIYIVDRGCAGMSTAGSGDVLTGVITGLSGFCSFPLEMVASLGAYICGVAGELAEEKLNSYSMTARDTVSFIGKVISNVIK